MADDVERTELFLAATRPALILGLPIGFFFIFLVMASLLMIFAQNPLYEAIVIPGWFGARLLVRYDYNGLRVFGFYLRTKGRSWDSDRWRGASPAPFPVAPGKTPRGIDP